ncbi:GNAT family N-acetyltransferase [Alteribacter lacisalsi]|nr:GNAT family N-acetyltransferase [Alteribacter lacisalsi]
MMTGRLKKIIRLGEEEARRAERMMEPADLLSGALLERTGVFAELYLTFPDLSERLAAAENISAAPSGVRIGELSILGGTETKTVFTRAQELRLRYDQHVLNEGHVMRAVLESEDHRLKNCLTQDDRQQILAIVSAPRDMIVPLHKKSFRPHTDVRRAVQAEHNLVRSFVQSQFGDGWLEAVDHAFTQTPVTLFKAEQNNRITGFAAYDAHQKQKGVLGPMGVSQGNRSSGAGTSLLFACLEAMQKEGYRYAVISEAGPVAFYESVCGATIIFEEHNR